MGNQPHFCCDHNAELRLFDSSQIIITNTEPNPQRTIPNALPAKAHQRIFSKDEVSIIDQLDIKSETVKEDLFLPMPILSDKSLKTSFDKENTRSYSRQHSMVIDQKWEQFKLEELQYEKRKQTDLIRKELEKQIKVRHCLKEKKKETNPKSSKDPQKSYDFQFIVNYR